jgi:hypothetical protein
MMIIRGILRNVVNNAGCRPGNVGTGTQAHRGVSVDTLLVCAQSR